ncbi:uncharacterized protein PHACADRAFT_177131 [Phanerochaete carnosa HHB-10118-sp]|uniref:Carboxypeptidase n=1 Tax=Phanerochaete carnosa (strain HHB-10118-sp) TaxID=650164 RepID=K5UPJ7_PHACS|nr:uncharacterized protein PHACADRAFT_177131 [Phanerochaete carnosa HHB-10118-sp]EKM51711.1 hypothetical protein PHACADRAFT_177131 [Phanerochaete carnosa HHB-10118-sp]
MLNYHPASMLLFPLLVACCRAQTLGGPPSTSPHDYGEPKGDYSSQWQSYFQVADSLSGVDFTLPNSYAGNIAVQREGHANDTLFFWAFEHQKESLTAAAGENGDTPWAIWLQGGPGTSSMLGLMTENGPIQVQPGTQKLVQNKYAWSNLVDYIWVDQPVGVGFATADSNGYAADEDQVGVDFIGFLDNLVKVFPSLATRPFYLTGESYAGRYIPYIVKTLFSMPNPPVQLSTMVVGNPAFGSNAEFKVMPTLTLIETYPQLIGYDTNVYDYFKQQSHLCGLDINLTYPQMGGILAPVNLNPGTEPTLQNQTQPDNDDDKEKTRGKNSRLANRSFAAEVAHRYSERRASGEPAQPFHERLRKRAAWTTDATNSSGISSYYGCDVWDEMLDYALNYTFPWCKRLFFCSTFDVPDSLDPEAPDDPTFFFTKVGGIDPSPEPMTFFTELATNATRHGIRIVTYVGNDDSISPHFGTEVTIQNTTFGGTQGFTRKPSTPWFNDDGDWAGIVHQERNWTYALFYGAGHEVPGDQPVSAYTFLREFILGNNQTGLVVSSGNTTSVIGDENPTLQQTAIPGQLAIDYGSTTTQGSTIWPSATVAAFESHVGQVSVTGTNAIKPTATSGTMSSVHPKHAGFVVFAIAMARLLDEIF